MSPLAHGNPPPAPDLPGMLLAWSPDPWVILPVALAAAWYARAARRFDRAHPEGRWPRGRTMAFEAGLGLVLVALVSPIAVYAQALFWVHMLQHLILIFGAAPLLVLGTPIALARRTAAWRGPLVRGLRSPAVRAATHPAATWSGLAVVLYASHFTGVYDAALESEAVHAAEHAVYLGAAALFWLPVVGREPGAHRLSHPGRMLYLFLAVPANAFLGVALYETVRPYEHYATLARAWGPTPLADQQAAGALMWIVGGLGMLAAVLIAGGAWARRERGAGPVSPRSRASAR